MESCLRAQASSPSLKGPPRRSSAGLDRVLTAALGWTGGWGGPEVWDRGWESCLQMTGLCTEERPCGVGGTEGQNEAQMHKISPDEASEACQPAPRPSQGQSERPPGGCLPVGKAGLDMSPNSNNCTWSSAPSLSSCYLLLGPPLGCEDTNPWPAPSPGQGSGWPQTGKVLPVDWSSRTDVDSQHSC